MGLKKETCLFLTILAIGCTCGETITNSDSLSSTFGKEFIFGIIYPFYTSPSVINLTILAQQPGSFQLNIPFHGINQTYQIDRVVHVIVKNNISKAGTFKEHRGIQITADVRVSILITNYNSFEAESYNVLPKTVLGKRYITENIPHHLSYDGGLMVIATVNGTQVQIKDEGKYSNLTLDELEVYQLKSDLTGYYIQSNNPIAVFTSTLMSVDKYPVFDVVSSQMQPINTYSRTFIVSSPVLNSSIIRIVYDKQIVHLAVNNRNQTINTTNSKVIEYTFSPEPVTITTDTPISVVQYIIESPAMIIVPSIDQFVNDYQFVVPHFTTSFAHHFSITIQSDKQDGLLYDGLTFHKLSTQVVPPPFSNYIVIHMNLPEEGFHNMTHTDKSVKFGLLIYGYNIARKMVGYAFYAGFHLNGSYNLPTTATTRSITSIPTSSSPGTGPLCFSCYRESHLRYCDTVDRCQQNEVCFVERHVKRHGSGTLIGYQSGCIQHDTCHVDQSQDGHCMECCSTDICNKQGCGDNGFPSINERGPLCFDCDNVGRPDECHQVNICHKGQRCFTEKYEWGSEFIYRFGCASEVCNPIVRRSGHGLDKRMTPICQECCDGDVCNTGCQENTQGVGIPDIVG